MDDRVGWFARLRAEPVIGARARVQGHAQLLDRWARPQYFAVVPRITLYATQFCPFCHRAKQLLDEYDIAYEEIDLGLEPERRVEMVERAGGRITVPQLFLDGQHVGGCDDLYALADDGGLDGIAGPLPADEDEA